MAVEIRVDTAQVKNVVRVFENTIQEWDSQKTAIWKALAELDAMWDGDANTEFNALTAEDEPKFTQLSEVLKAFKEALNQAAVDYEQNEEVVTRIVQG